jgi:hypothetical protein
MYGSVQDCCNHHRHRSQNFVGNLHSVSLLLIAFPLDDASLGRVLEITAGRNEGTASNEGGHLRPRTIRILFEGIAGQLGKARGIGTNGVGCGFCGV